MLFSHAPIKSKNSTRLPLIQNHHQLALQDGRDKMVVMQDSGPGDFVTILRCSQISLKNGILPISTNQELKTCGVVCHTPRANYRKLYCDDVFLSQKENKN
jgi:hypothetical protein